MSAPAAVAATARPRPTRLRATVRSEWIKLWSVRSVPAVLTVALLVVVGGGWVLGAGYRADWASMSAGERLAFDPAFTSLRGIQLAELLVGALGVLAVTGEYGTGLIRTTMAATPQRVQVLAVKALVLAAVVWALCTAAALAAFALGQSQFTGPVPHASLGQPGVLRAVLGGGLFLTLVALFGAALGALTRSTALGLTSFFGLLLVVPVVVDLLPGSLSSDISPYLPGDAGERLWHVLPPPAHALGPWQGAGLFALYVAVALGAALVLVRRRDV